MISTPFKSCGGLTDLHGLLDPLSGRPHRILLMVYSTQRTNKPADLTRPQAGEEIPSVGERISQHVSGGPQILSDDQKSGLEEPLVRVLSKLLVRHTDFASPCAQHLCLFIHYSIDTRRIEETCGRAEQVMAPGGPGGLDGPFGICTYCTVTELPTH
jgi:hypothetical protein